MHVLPLAMHCCRGVYWMSANEALGLMFPKGHKNYYVIDTGLNTNRSRFAFLSTEVIKYNI
jgi:hypothetical protein